MYSLHALELQLDPGPVVLYILGMDSDLWVDIVETVIYSSVMGNMRKLLYIHPDMQPIHLSGLWCWGAHVPELYRQQCGCVSLGNYLHISQSWGVQSVNQSKDPLFSCCLPSASSRNHW